MIYRFAHIGYVQDMMSSTFLAVNARAIDIGHIRVGKRMIKHQGVLPFLGRLSKDASEAKIAGIAHRNDPSLYISSEEDIVFMIQAADALVKSDDMTTAVSTNYFLLTLLGPPR